MICNSVELDDALGFSNTCRQIRAEIYHWAFSKSTFQINRGWVFTSLTKMLMPDQYHAIKRVEVQPDLDIWRRADDQTIIYMWTACDQLHALGSATKLKHVLVSFRAYHFTPNLIKNGPREYEDAVQVAMRDLELRKRKTLPKARVTFVRLTA